MRQFRDTPYYVTEDGKVFRHYPKREYISFPLQRNGKRYKQVRQVNEKWYPIKPLVMPHGYYKISISINNKVTTYYLHRLVAECYLGPCPKNKEVDHIDGDKANNHISNLQYLTKQENLSKREGIFSPCPSK